MPARMARGGNSGTLVSESMYGRNSSGGAVELQVFVAKRHLNGRTNGSPRLQRPRAAHYRLKPAIRLGWSSRPPAKVTNRMSFRRLTKTNRSEASAVMHR